MSKRTTTRVTSPTSVKKYALEVAAQHRPHNGFTRVSKEFLDGIEASTRAAILHRVKSHPSVGITLK